MLKTDCVEAEDKVEINGKEGVITKYYDSYFLVKYDDGTSDAIQYLDVLRKKHVVGPIDPVKKAGELGFAVPRRVGNAIVLM